LKDTVIIFILTVLNVFPYYKEDNENESKTKYSWYVIETIPEQCILQIMSRDFFYTEYLTIIVLAPVVNL